MMNRENKYGFSSVFLAGVLILLIMAVFTAPTFAQRTSLTNKQGTMSILSIYDPFLLQKVTFTPVEAPASDIRLAGMPRGNKSGKPPVVVPGRRAVRSQWMPGDGPPPRVFPIFPRGLN
jgi:hypothetical protein